MVFTVSETFRQISPVTSASIPFHDAMIPGHEAVLHLTTIVTETYDC